jgi:hypothetical protein
VKSYLLLELILCIGLAQGCRQKNPIGADEKALAKTILVEEALNQKGKSALKPEDPNHPSNSPVVLGLKEDRSVNLEYPPLILDVLASRNNIKQFKMSDVVSSVRYVQLETPLDTNLLSGDLSFYFTENGIISKGLMGITYFSKKGEVMEVICSNRMDVTVTSHGLNYSTRSLVGNPPFSGISVINNRVYYRYDNNMEKTSHVLSHQLPDIQNVQLDLSENQNQTMGKGRPIGELLPHTGFQGSTHILAINENQWMDFHSKMISGSTGTLMVNYSLQGDTICAFSDFDRVVDFTSPQISMFEEEVCYYYNGIPTIKIPYNDTLFRVISSNRLLPVYVINFGSYKPSHMEGLNPLSDLSEKFLCRSFSENQEWVFFVYSQDHPNKSRREGRSVKIHFTLFNKQNKTFYHNPVVAYEEFGIENDLDGGIPFWPDYVTPAGELVMHRTGKQIKEYIFSVDFEQREIPEDQRDKQVLMAKSLKDNDQVLMFVR